MKILILNWRDPKHPNAGGAEIVTHEHAKAWVRAGHEVTLFSSFYQSAKGRETIDGIKIIRKGYAVFAVQLQALLWYLLEKHETFDLVIDQFHGIPFFTPLYCKQKKLAFIHEVAKEVWKLNPWPRPFHLIPSLIGTTAEPWIFKLLYRRIPFMTVSESTKDDLINWGIPEKNITIIHNGISVPTAMPRFEKEKKKTIMFLGSLSKDKGIIDAMHVFSFIDKQNAGWQFWIVGNGEKSYLEQLKQISNKLGISNKITFWGYVDEKKKFELLAKAHVLVNPSIREGWGLVNIEANSVGTPVVAYDVSGCRDSVKNGETGVLTSLGNYAEMADNINKLLSNTNRYEKFRQKALVWSKQFSWEKAAVKSTTLIESFVHG